MAACAIRTAGEEEREGDTSDSQKAASREPTTDQGGEERSKIDFQAMMVDSGLQAQQERLFSSAKGGWPKEKGEQSEEGSEEQESFTGGGNTQQERTGKATGGREARGRGGNQNREEMAEGRREIN